jgi:hypothetical protein
MPPEILAILVTFILHGLAVVYAAGRITATLEALSKSLDKLRENVETTASDVATLKTDVALLKREGGF